MSPSARPPKALRWALRPLLAGEAVSTWRAPDDEVYDVKVRLSQADRDSRGDLERIYVASSLANADGSPKMVALRQVGSRTGPLNGGVPTSVQTSPATRRSMPSAASRNPGSRRQAHTHAARAAVASADAHSTRSRRWGPAAMPPQHRL